MVKTLKSCYGKCKRVDGKEYESEVLRVSEERSGKLVVTSGDFKELAGKGKKKVT